MPCAQCDGTNVNDQFDDRIHDQDPFRMGAWHWASRCSTCGTMVYERAESLVTDTSSRIDRANPMPVFQLFEPTTWQP
ncbi:MAG TPA: hypothetical protein VGQ08_17750 [Nitrospiraceae bacterium]|jgi:hypothetical protein|nr:hypothetical protein [Nitrospiraceae bacterium]